MANNYSVVLKDLGPVSSLRLNDTAGPTAADVSGPRNAPGTYVGTAPTFSVTGPISGDTTSKGVTLDGSTDYIEVPQIVADAIGQGNAAFSIVAWVNPNAATPTGFIAGMLDGSNDGGFSLTLASGIPHFFRYNSSAASDTIVGGAALTESAWSMVVAVYDGTNLNLYVNGAAAATAVASSKVIPAYVDAEFAFGANYAAGGAVANFLAASFSETAVFNYALTLADVQALYHLGSGVTVTAADPQDILDGVVPFAHIATTNTEGSPTTFAVNTNAGTSATATATSTSNDMAGQITVTISATPAKGDIVDVTFGVAYAKAPVVFLTPVSTKAYSDELYVVTATTSGFSVGTVVTATSADSVVFNYLVVETQ